MRWELTRVATFPAAAESAVGVTDPALAYLASLSPNGRLAMVKRLRAIVAILGVPIEAIARQGLRFAHVAAIR